MGNAPTFYLGKLGLTLPHDNDSITSLIRMVNTHFRIIRTSIYTKAGLFNVVSIDITSLIPTPDKANKF